MKTSFKKELVKQKAKRRKYGGWIPNEAAAVAICKISVAVFRWAEKKSKCRNKNGTIDGDKLMDWLRDNPPIGIEDEKEINFHLEKAKDMRASRMLKEQKRDERAKQLIPIATLRSAWARNIIACKSKMYASENTIAVEAGLILGLTKEQIEKLKAIVVKTNRLAIKEMNQGEFGKCICLNCEKEIV